MSSRYAQLSEREYTQNAAKHIIAHENKKDFYCYAFMCLNIFNKVTKEITAMIKLWHTNINQADKDKGVSF